MSVTFRITYDDERWWNYPYTVRVENSYYIPAVTMTRWGARRWIRKHGARWVEKTNRRHARLQQPEEVLERHAVSGVLR